jgi:hypothetical protein
MAALFKRLFGGGKGSGGSRGGRPSVRPALEGLEDRLALSPMNLFGTQFNLAESRQPSNQFMGTEPLRFLSQTPTTDTPQQHGMTGVGFVDSFTAQTKDPFTGMIVPVHGWIADRGNGWNEVFMVGDSTDTVPVPNGPTRTVHIEGTVLTNGVSGTMFGNILSDRIFQYPAAADGTPGAFVHTDDTLTVTATSSFIGVTTPLSSNSALAAPADAQAATATGGSLVGPSVADNTALAAPPRL